MRWYLPHLLVGGLLGLLVLVGVDGVVRDGIDNARFKLTSRPASQDVVVVAIDATSIQKIGVWPWPRRLHADVLNKLHKAGASDVAFDVDFSSHSTAANDSAFAAALRNAGGSTILPLFQQFTTNAAGKRSVLVSRPPQEFEDHAWVANVNIQADADGKVRHYGYGSKVGDEFVPSLGALIAGAYNENASPFVIDHGIDVTTIPVVSFKDVLDGKVDPKLLEGKRVIVGGTAIELGDRFVTGTKRIVAGPVLQALAAESILQGRELVRNSDYLAWTGFLLLAVLMSSLFRRFRAASVSYILIGVAAAVEAAAALTQSFLPILIDTSLWHLAIMSYMALAWLREINIRGLVAYVAQQRFQTLAHSLGDGVAYLDAQGDIRFWNRGATNIFGVPEEDAVGKKLADVCTLHRPSGASFHVRDLTDEALFGAGGHIVELVGRSSEGDAIPLEVSFSAWDDASGRHFGVIMRDVSDRKASEERIRYLAEYDYLTGLANRSTLSKHLTGRIETAQMRDEPLALLLMDVDHFKEINDTVGHKNGDKVLKEFGHKLETVFGDDGFVARLGGDEFVVLLEGADAKEKAEQYSEHLLEMLNGTPFVLEGYQFYFSTSVGCAFYPEHGDSAEDLLGNADIALYRAKDEGRGVFRPFTNDLREKLAARRTLAAELHDAVKRREFALFYQPQIRLSDGALVGAEALIRWRHPERGVLAPGAFISVVEDGPLAQEVGNWVIEEACAQAQDWRSVHESFRVGVNLSSAHFRGDLSGFVKETLKRTGLPASCLELEITENILLDSPQEAISHLQQLKDIGVGIALDDFGTGFASLTHLKEFPLDRIKIDQSFVRDLAADPGDRSIVRAVAWLGQQLGLEIIAEGIEEAPLIPMLKQLGCHEGQGYYFSRPVSEEEFAKNFLLRATAPMTHDDEWPSVFDARETSAA